MVSAQARRSQVEFASHRGISVRRVCALIGVARSTMGYEAKMPAKDGPVITVMRDLSSQYPRYGSISFAVRWGHRSMCDAKARGSCRQRGETIC